jgi:hypothetical protein
MGYCSKTVKNYNPAEKPQEDNIQNVDEWKDSFISRVNMDDYLSSVYYDLLILLYPSIYIVWFRIPNLINIVSLSSRMFPRNSRKKHALVCRQHSSVVGNIDDRGSQSNHDFDSISPESCHNITREQAYSGNEIGLGLVLFTFFNIQRFFTWKDWD